MELANETPPSKKSRAKPKVSIVWNEADTLKLIALVEAEPCLWDAGSDGYHNKLLRDNAWKCIGLNFENKYLVSDLSAKWTNLRIQYRGYAARSKTKSGQGTVDVPKWRFFSVMSFVGRAEDVQSQETTSNFLLEAEDKIDESITPTLSQSSRHSQARNSPSAANKIADTMREALVTIQERQQKAFDPNITFANYLVSELRTLSEEDATKIRRLLTQYFLKCTSELT